MSDVIEFATRTPGPKKAETKHSAVERKIEHYNKLEGAFGDVDAFHLMQVTEWKVSRAKAEIAWAKQEFQDGWGDISNSHRPDMQHYRRMRNAEGFLVRAEPYTMRLAAELLNVCIEILSKREIDPEHTLATGPVLDIIRNVKGALEYPSGTTRLRPDERSKT